MTAKHDDTTTLVEAVRSLTDRAEISELIDRYITAFDVLTERPRDDAWYRNIFTDDVRLTFPVGSHRGITGLAEFQRTAKAKWARTHHLTSNYVIDVDGDRATVRAHLLATHVYAGDAPQGRLSVGSHADAAAIRTQAGWRLRELTFGLVWSAAEVSPPR
jgi:hypothetical protein